MKSALECFQQAIRCEQMAKAAHSAKDSAALFDAARQWRVVGKAMEAEELRALDAATPIERRPRGKGECQP
jgi:hypothetical protein